MAKNVQEKSLDVKLINVYKTYGVKAFLDVCAEMLNIRDSDNFEKKKKTNGEVCEVVLSVLTADYLRIKHYNGSVFHSMVLPDRDNPKSEFRTELDFTLMTPGFCLSGECKSFVGDITVTGDCTLNRGNMTADVAKQSLLHGKYLRKYLEEYMLPDKGMPSPPFGLFCFLYSNGTVKDRRLTKQRELIPVLTIKTLYRYYDQIFKAYEKEVYDYERACKQFDAFANSSALHRQHRQYLGY